MVSVRRYLFKKKFSPLPVYRPKGRYTGRGENFFDVVLFTACFVHTADIYTESSKSSQLGKPISSQIVVNMIDFLDNQVENLKSV